MKKLFFVNIAVFVTCILLILFLPFVGIEFNDTSSVVLCSILVVCNVIALALSVIYKKISIIVPVISLILLLFSIIIMRPLINKKASIILMQKYRELETLHNLNKREKVD